MTAERLRTQLEGAIQALVALSVVWLGLAAGNAYPWNIPIGRAVRWAALVELVVLALAYAVVTRHRLPRPRSLVVPLLVGFGGLALLSAAWSVDPGLTLGRAVTLLAVLAAAGALAAAASQRGELVEVLLLGLVAGVVVLALLGLAQVWNDPDRAIVPATRQSPARYSGIGGNPNTVAMLVALVLPAVAWLLASAASTARRVVAIAVLALLYGSLVASGSRGALLGALLGTLVFAAVARLGRRRTQLTAVAAFALFALGIAAFQLPQPAETDPVIPFDIVPPTTPRLSEADVQPKLPLESEIGFPRSGDPPFRRTLFTSSGRFEAWQGALERALARPLLGYGFGTEDRVFVDRYYLHYAARPESAYLGTLLQLGLVGGAVVLALLGGVAARSRRATGAAAACAGAVACGLVLAVGQSYLTAAGSPAMLPFWICALLLLGATASAASQAPEAGRER